MYRITDILKSVKITKYKDNTQMYENQILFFIIKREYWLYVIEMLI